jgi:hypothetical protein
MAQQTKHAQHPASSPSRPRRPGAGVAGGSGPRRAFHCGARRSCRWSECRKSLQAPGLGAFRRLTRGGDCVQEEGGYEYISNHQDAESGKQEAHLETGVLYQPLESAAPSNEATTGVVPLCEQNTSSTGCTRDAGGVGHSVGRKLERSLSHDDSGNVCVGVGTTAAVVSPFAPELAGVLVGVFLAVRC